MSDESEIWGSVEPPPERHVLTYGWTTPLERDLREQVIKLEARLLEQEADFKRRIGQSVNYALDAAWRLNNLVLMEHLVPVDVREEAGDEILALKVDGVD